VNGHILIITITFSEYQTNNFDLNSFIILFYSTYLFIYLIFIIFIIYQFVMFNLIVSDVCAIYYYLVYLIINCYEIIGALMWLLLFNLA